MHIEPIHNAVDLRVRTSRVDVFWRAVMFRLDSDGERHYVIHGIGPRDDAHAVAQRVRLSVNPINCLPHADEIAPPVAPVASDTALPVSQQLVVRLGHDRSARVDALGLPSEVTDQALAATDEDAVLDLA